MTGPSSTCFPLVSVIINCYNGERYLKDAIDSVFAQTYNNWEIIFWDNASTDKSAMIAKAYGKRIRYFRGETNIPLGAARNEAMKHALGAYIGFLDCDDIWLPDKLSRQILIMEANPSCALCYGGVELIDSEGRHIGEDIPAEKSGNIFRQLLKQFDINLPTAFIRKAVLDECGLNFDSNVTASEEYCLFMQLAVECSFRCVRSLYAKYRIHEGALTNKSIENWAKEREYTLNLILKKNQKLANIYPRAFQEAFARARYYRARLFVSLGMSREARNELRKNIWIDIRYFVLWMILFLPKEVWNIIHVAKSKRKNYC